MGNPAVDLTRLSLSLRELVERAARSGEIVLTDGGEAVAKIVPIRYARAPRRPGSARGTVEMADDFDVTPADFKDYI